MNHVGTYRTIWFVVVLVLLTGLDVFGQRTKNKKKASENKPFYAYETEATLRKKDRKPLNTGESSYYVEKPVASRFENVERSDVDISKPPYFGHRKPVVKRRPKAQRMCRVCGIRH